MPEIAEVHRLCHFLRRHVLGRKISTVHVQEDTIVYGKVGCSASEFQKAMTNKTVVDVKQQGKYFWLVMSSPPHALMHLGMTGWIDLSNDVTGHYRAKEKKEAEWPPRFWKFRLVMEGKPECEVAFVDPRRLARIRLVDVAAEEMRKTTPLKENGPDPIVDKDILTKEWLRTKLRSKKVPVKALLLDQGNISGIGNWVADEVLYQAKIHPEQYSNTFSDTEIDRLHDKIMEVCDTACGLLADSDQFPSTWLMKHRWNKGKKDSNVLPNGEKIVHIKVGGRTSAVVPSVQKKTGAVAGDVSPQNLVDDDEAEEDIKEEEVEKPKKKGATKAVADKVNGSVKAPGNGKRKAQTVEEKPDVKKQKEEKPDTRKQKEEKLDTKKQKVQKATTSMPTRRSSRRSN